MTEDERNLDLLGIFHYVAAGLLALISCMPLIHVTIGILIMSGKIGDGCSQSPPPEVGLLFLLIGSAFVIGGWAMAIVIMIAGSKLKQRKSRTFCLVVAGISCMFMPIGTVLGIFTIIMLTKPSVIELFAERQEGYGGPL